MRFWMFFLVMMLKPGRQNFLNSESIFLVPSKLQTWLLGFTDKTIFYAVIITVIHVAHNLYTPSSYAVHCLQSEWTGRGRGKLMCQFELSLGSTVGLCVWVTLFTLIPFQSVQCDWRAIVWWCLKERKSVNKEVIILLVMEQNKTMARVLVESKAWVILFF